MFSLHQLRAMSPAKNYKDGGQRGTFYATQLWIEHALFTLLQNSRWRLIRMEDQTLTKVKLLLTNMHNTVKILI